MSDYGSAAWYAEVAAAADPRGAAPGVSNRELAGLAAAFQADTEAEAG